MYDMTTLPDNDHTDDHLSDFGRGWDAAARDLNSGLAKPGDPGFQPPVNDYQRGYNSRIDAPQGPGVIGVSLVLAIGLAIIGCLYFVLRWTEMVK